MNKYLVGGISAIGLASAALLFIHPSNNGSFSSQKGVGQSIKPAYVSLVERMSSENPPLVEEYKPCVSAPKPPGIDYIDNILMSNKDFVTVDPPNSPDLCGLELLCTQILNHADLSALRTKGSFSRGRLSGELIQGDESRGIRLTYEGPHNSYIGLTISGLGTDQPLSLTMSIYGVDDRVGERIVLDPNNGEPRIMGRRRIFEYTSEGRIDRGSIGVPAVSLDSSSYLYSWLQYQKGFLETATE